MSENKSRPNYRRQAILLTISLSIFRLFMGSLTGLGDSEAYYWNWSQHLSLSYYDHPPMVAYIMAIFTKIGGNSVFFVRLGSAIFFILTMAMFYLISQEIFDSPRVGFLSIVIFNIVPVFAIGALQMVPDIPCGLFWLISIYLFYKIIEEDSPKLWYPFGVSLGLGLLSKYFAILLIPSIVLVCLGKDYRHWFRRKEPYLAMLIALLVFSPVIIWNYRLGFPSFTFHLINRHSTPPFSFFNALQFTIGQFLYMSPLLLAGLLYALYLSYKKWHRERDRRYFFLFWTSFPTLLFFYVVSLWTREAEPHWPAFGYFTAIIAASALIDGYLEKGAWNRGKILRVYSFMAASLAIFMTLFFYLQIFYPVWKPRVAKYDITNELWGWDLVGERITKSYNALSSEGEAFVISNHWVLAGQIGFATENKIPNYKVNKQLDQFNFWQDNNSLIGKNLLYVGDNRFTDDPAELYRCDKIVREPDLFIYRKGNPNWARYFTFYRCYGYNGRR